MKTQTGEPCNGSAGAIGVLSILKKNAEVK